jgi:antitoxin (DNA-binding transcriptional repressor) of toxin-antitoxin stability system
MRKITLEVAQSHLGEIIDKMVPGEEVLLTRGDKPVPSSLPDRSRSPALSWAGGKVCCPLSQKMMTI